MLYSPPLSSVALHERINGHFETFNTNVLYPAISPLHFDKVLVCYVASEYVLYYDKYKFFTVKITLNFVLHSIVKNLAFTSYWCKLFENMSNCCLWIYPNRNQQKYLNAVGGKVIELNCFTNSKLLNAIG